MDPRDLEKVMGVCGLASIGLLIVMMLWSLFNWLCKAPVPDLSVLAQLIISELSYPPEKILNFREGYYYGSHNWITTPQKIIVRESGYPFWHWINCDFQNVDVSYQLTKYELKVIYQYYINAVAQQYRRIEREKNQKYIDALAESKKCLELL